MVPGNQIGHVDISTPIGSLRIAGTPQVLWRIFFPNDTSRASELGEAVEDLSLYPALAEAYKYIKAYFAGDQKLWGKVTVPDSTSFQIRVWNETAKIPFGSTVSYSGLAELTGKPGAARAVGSAMAKNPIPILVPCHRVIRTDGGLGGFGGGLDVKEWLLEFERVNKMGTTNDVI